MINPKAHKNACEQELKQKHVRKYVDGEEIFWNNNAAERYIPTHLNFKLKGQPHSST